MFVCVACARVINHICVCCLCLCDSLCTCVQLLLHREMAVNFLQLIVASAEQLSPCNCPD